MLFEYVQLMYWDFEGWKKIAFWEIYIFMLGFSPKLVKM
jgi:hypothetical protein